MLPGWVYSIIGVVVVLFAFRSMVRGAIRDYFRLPRKQKVRGAVLPVETITAALRKAADASVRRHPGCRALEVQTRTMSRIESTPTSSGPS